MGGARVRSEKERAELTSRWVENSAGPTISSVTVGPSPLATAASTVAGQAQAQPAFCGEEPSSP